MGKQLDEWNKDMLLIGAVSYMVDPEGTKSVAKGIACLFFLLCILGGLIVLVANLIQLNLLGIIVSTCWTLLCAGFTWGCSDA